MTRRTIHRNTSYCVVLDDTATRRRRQRRRQARRRRAEDLAVRVAVALILAGAFFVASIVL